MIKPKKALCCLLSVLLIAMSFVSAASIAFADAGTNLGISLSVDKSSVYTGDTFTYSVSYRNASTTQDASGVTVTDVLPANIKYVSYTNTVDIASVNVTNDGTHDVVTFNFNNPLAAGRSGVLKISAKFPEGTTLDTINGQANVASNSATIATSNSSVVSNTVNVTPMVKSPDWSVTKTRVSPSSVLPTVDQNVVYAITVNGNSTIGGLNLKNIIVTDTLPTNSVFVSADNGGTLTGNTVVWNIASLNVGASKILYVTLKYPSSSFTSSSSVTNNVSCTGTLISNVAAPTVTASVTHGLADPVFSIGQLYKNGRQSNDRYSVGQTANFYIGGIKNTGNTSIDSIDVVDTIPNEITLTSISTGSFNNSINETIYYKTNLNSSWRTWTGSPFANPSNATLNVSSLSLQSGEKVTAVKWTIGSGSQSIPVDFQNNSEFKVNGTVAMPASGNKITNSVTETAYQGTNTLVKTASKDIYVIAAMPWLVPTKTVKNNQVSFNFGDTVQFNLKIQNNAFATGSYVNPIAVDTLDPAFENYQFLSYSQGNSSITAQPVIDTSSTKTINGKQYQLLKFKLNGTLNPGEYVVISYTVRIKNLTAAGFLTNSLFIGTQDNSTTYENDSSQLVTDTNDIDGDTSTTDNFIESDAKIFVKFQGSLGSVLSNKGSLDSTWSPVQYPGYVQTVAGGMADYKLVVNNDGSNGPIKNIVMINKLPTVGDTGVVDSSSRGSQWTPYLVNKITGVDGAALPAGTKIYYTTNANPSCQELSDTINNKGLTSDGWSLTPPADITTVKAIKVDFGPLVLNTGDSVAIQWPLRAPIGASAGMVAWDSFGFGATYTDVNSAGTSTVDTPFLPSEPKMVGFKIHEPVPINIGNYVWDDANKNGIQDSGETGINGVLVNLYVKDGENYDFVNYTRTGYSADGKPGFYEFVYQPAGIYRLEFVYPKTNTDSSSYTSTYYLSPYRAGSDSTLDSDGNPSTLKDVTIDSTTYNSVITPDYYLTSDDMSIGLGLYKTASVSNKVWYDKNANGIQDSGENGLANVTVKLLDGNGNPAVDVNGVAVSSQTTDANGNYNFTGLAPGTYKVQFTVPTGYKTSPVSQGTDITLDSDGVPSSDNTTATTAAFTLVSGQSKTDIDQGFYLGHIGNSVWEDKNANGIKDSGELGVSGVTVKLYKNGSSTALLTTTTDSSGNYSFDDLLPGNYVVTVFRPGSYSKFSIQPTGTTTDAIDNDSDVNSTGSTASFALTAGERIDTIDCGMYKFATIGDKVWHDLNGNGIQDSGEFGISGIKVRLTDTNGNAVIDGNGAVVADATTNASGNYSFTKLNPGIYVVHFVNTNQVYLLSPYKAGGTDSNDSDGIFTTNKDAEAVTNSITVISGQTNNNVDQGMYLASIGDKVWEDKNANGIQDSGETGIAGATVSLIDATTLLPAKDAFGNTVSSVTTDANGNYQFVNLAAGTYIVSFAKPTGFDLASDKALGSDRTKDSDINTITFKTDSITLTAGQRKTDIDAGFYKLASIGDTVFADTNGDGIRQITESGISGATVHLYKADGVTQAIDAYGNPVADKVTDANGNYLFIRLKPGSYVVKFDKPAGYDSATDKAQGTDRTVDSDIDVATLKTAVITVTSGQINADIDAGFYKYASLGDFVWNDKNANGIQDYGEPGVPNVTVNLYDKNGLFVKSTTSDANGKYTFTSLKPSAYKIGVILPSGYDKVTDKNKGTDPTIDNDINPSTLLSDSVSLVSGYNYTTTDIGLFAMSSVNCTLGIWTSATQDNISSLSATVYQYAPCYFKVKTIPDVTSLRLFADTGAAIDITSSKIISTYIGTDGMKYWIINNPFKTTGTKTVTFSSYAFGRWSGASIYCVQDTVLTAAILDVKTNYKSTDVNYTTSTILAGTNAYYSVKTDSTVTQIKIIINGTETIVPVQNILSVTTNTDGTKQWLVSSNFTTIGTYDVQFRGYKDSQWINQTVGVTTNVVKPIISIQYGSTQDVQNQTTYECPQNVPVYIRVKTPMIVDSLTMYEDNSWYQKVTSDQIISVTANGDGTKDWLIRMPFNTASSNKNLQFVAGYNGIVAPVSNLPTSLIINTTTIQSYKVSADSITFTGTSANIIAGFNAYFSFKTNDKVTQFKFVVNGVEEVVPVSNVIACVNMGDGTKSWMISRQFATSGSYTINVYGYVDGAWQTDYRTVSVSASELIQSVLTGTDANTINQTAITAKAGDTTYIKIRTLSSVSNLMLNCLGYYEIVPSANIVSVTDNGNGTKDWIITRVFTTLGTKSISYEPYYNGKWQAPSCHTINITVTSDVIKGVLTGTSTTSCNSLSTSNYANFPTYFIVVTYPNVTDIVVTINGVQRPLVIPCEKLNVLTNPDGSKQWLISLRHLDVGVNTVGFKGYIGGVLSNQTLTTTVTINSVISSITGGTTQNSLTSTAFSTTMATGSYVKVTTIPEATNLMMVMNGSYYEVVTPSMIVSKSVNANGQIDWILRRPFTLTGTKNISYEAMVNGAWSSPFANGITVNVTN
ncbi:MAG: SdrD B-like domain-containing protein [Bacillota bacterium]|nr:SdrD B-like domain-containing protein [Bacillota bacterium]